MNPGMMPILHSSAVITPGQLGPISRTSFPSSARFTFTMSFTGMPSVIQMISLMPASAASRMASAANGGGTKIRETSPCVFFSASRTVLNTGIPSTSWPALPGVTPATTCVPYALHCVAWNEPSLPVIPCTTTRVALFTNMLIIIPFQILERPSGGWRRSRP